MENGRQLIVNGRQYTVNSKQLTVLAISFILLVSFVTVAIATGFFGINTTKVSSLEKGLVGHWMLDAENGAKDLTPYGNHGTAQGGITIGGAEDRKGKSGGATEFDGNDGYIGLLIGKGIEMGNPLTVSMWVKPNTLGSKEMIFHSGPGSNQRLYIGQIDGTWDFGIQSSAWSSSSILATTEWQHIILSMNGTQANLYVDGEYKYYKTYSSFTLVNDFYIGRDHSGNYPFNGTISDVRIYNRVLSDDEIQLLFDSYKPATSASDLNKGLVGHWMLDAENGAKDLTPYGNHGTGQGGITIGGAEDRKGKGGGATSFDGVDDYIDLDENILDNTIQGTISLLVRVDSWSESYNTILTKSDGVSWNHNHIQISRDGSSNYISLTISNNTHSTSNQVRVGPINLGEWYRVSMLWDGNMLSGFLNGILSSNYNTNIYPANDSTRFSLGRGAVGASRYFKGLISDVRIYNRALSEDEIKLLFDSYKPKEASVGNLNKGLVLDMPLTTKWMKSSTIVSDRTPYGNDGTLMNGVNITSEGAVFDGVNGGMNISNSDSLNLANELTISAWIKSNNFGGGYRVILLKTWNGRSYCFELYSNKLDFSLSQNSATTWDLLSHLQSLNTLNNNEWRHVVATYNGVIGKVYVDGNFDNSKSSSGGPIRSTTSNINIGYSSSQEHINGSISNIKVYNRALSDEEVKLLYEKGRW